MPYINVGAVVNGRPPGTKRELKVALAEAPETVTFESTSDLGTPFYGTGSDVKPGVTLTVVGPDPYRNRKWYASVSVSDGGKLTCK